MTTMLVVVELVGGGGDEDGDNFDSFNVSHAAFYVWCR